MIGHARIQSKIAEIAAVPNILQQKVKRASNAMQASNTKKRLLPFPRGEKKEKIQPIFNFTTPSLICLRIIPNELVVQRDSSNPHKTKQELKTTNTNNKNTKSVHSSFNSITCIIQPDPQTSPRSSTGSEIKNRNEITSYIL